MICLMGGVGWHGTRLGRSDSDMSGSYGKPEVTNSGSVISCASCVTSHSTR